MTEVKSKQSEHISRLPDPAALSAGEFNRSRSTRLNILNAGVAVLADTGYKKLSTGAVAKKAGMTRASMLYHFGSRREMLEAIIHHVTRRRIDMYIEAMSELPHDDNFLSQAVETAWEQLQTPEFAAYTELSLAARTDKELRELMQPALAAYDESRRDSAHKLFPDYLANDAEFDLRRDIVRFLTEGIAQQNGLTFNRIERLDRMMRFLKTLLTSPEGVVLMRKVVSEETEGVAD